MTSDAAHAESLSPSEAREALDREARAAGLSAQSTFVPLSRSRNQGSKHPTLNWSVRIYRRAGSVGAGANSRPVDVLVLTADYSTGIGHLPNYDREPPSYWRTTEGHDRMWRAAETGRTTRSRHLIQLGINGTTIPEPELVDVLGCRLRDADALDEPDFESWASSTGSDPDSRKGEAVYRACLETALKLRSALGSEQLDRLRSLAAQL